MKRQLLKPGFEFIFSLCILAILGLPPLVFAQNKKDLNITINNGDTTINGKNIKKLSAKDRQNALKDIANIDGMNTINIDAGQDARSGDMVIIRDKQAEPSVSRIVIERPGTASGVPLITEGHGANAQVIQLRSKTQDGKDSVFTFNYRLSDEQGGTGQSGVQVSGFRMNDLNAEPVEDGGPRRVEMRRFRMPETRMINFERKNTQNFVYSSTDNNGISTHANYRVSDNHETLDKPEDAKNTQLGMLELQDLNIVPQFAAGKTVLMFNLSSKAAADVQLKDSKGNVLWNEKALNGSFNKSFSLGLNGIYYLQVKQAGKVAVKRIAKEE